MSLPVVSVEAGSTFGWDRYADTTIGIDTFGASAPDSVLAEKYGFDPETIASQVMAIL